MGSEAVRLGGRVSVARPELVARLGTAPIALVIAAAGYGKTRLLQEWETTDPREFRWLSPQEAVECAGGTLPASTVFVIDDLDQAVSAAPELQRAIRVLADAPGTSLALAGRSIDARLATSLRLDADVVEIDEDDLAFDDVSARSLLDGRCDDETVAVLVDRTEGWPAGLRLAALALDEGMAPDSFSGRDRSVEEYLRSTVLRKLDASSLAFLRSCAVFDTLDAGLCDHALDRRDSYAVLSALEGSHLFVRALDRSREWFTIHPLVRASLATQLERIDPSAASMLRRRGADWLARHGRSREGLVLRLTDGDADGAAQLLADVVLPMFSAGDLDPLIGLIHRIGPNVAIRNGFLATMFAYAGVMTGDTVCATRWCLTAQRLYAAHRFASTEEEVAYFTLRAHLAPDGFEVMADDARHALAIADEASPWRVPALMLVGISALLRGDAATASPLLDETVHRSAETGIRPSLVLALAERALLQSRDGRPSRIRDDLDAAQVAIGDEMRHYPHAALVWAMTALYRHHDGDVEAARAAFHTANALRPIAGGTMPWLGVQLRTVLARVAVALGDIEMARGLLGEARVLLEALPDAVALRSEIATVGQAVAPLPSGRATLPLLTAAELRVLPLLSSHLSFEEIGARLHLSRHTVKTQAISVYRKLGVTSRSDAVVHARELGLLEV
ncbi:LuxR C-terminal-related transcriptional regulator [Microbacterium sp. C23T]